MITITKQPNNRWLLDYDAPEGAQVGGYRCTFESLHSAINSAVEYAGIAEIECVVKIKGEK